MSEKAIVTNRKATAKKVDKKEASAKDKKTMVDKRARRTRDYSDGGHLTVRNTKCLAPGLGSMRLICSNLSFTL